ncbi:MAG: hypothetical protein DMF49_06375 [Acidobacteria bacterium]|nr:MAG: hypothetical protein DMF49_06375 [Acidobacteriota bacterium]
MEDRTARRLPFEIETGGPGSSQAAVPGGEDGGSSRTSRSPRIPLSALALLLALICILGYVSTRQLGPRKALDLPSGLRGEGVRPDREGARPGVVSGTGSARTGGVAQRQQPDRPAEALAGGSASGPAGRSETHGDVATGTAQAGHPDPLAEALAGRYANAARLWDQALSRRADSSTWTLQLSANCDAAYLHPLFGGPEARPQFFLLPITLKDRSCFRVCYGFFPDRVSAEQEARALSTHPPRQGVVARAVRLTDLLSR